MATYKRRMITDKDKLRLGNCTCVVRDKHTGRERLADGSVARVPYNKNASKEVKQKYGKNLVYVIYRDYEDIVGYYQPPKDYLKSKRK